MDAISRAYRDPGGPPPEVPLAGLASRQHGLVSGRQLLALGLTKHAVSRRVAGGRLIRLHRGVFAVGHTALTADSRRLAAVMACGPGSLLSHRAAGGLQGLLPTGPRLEVTAPRGRKGAAGVEVHTSRVLTREDRATVRRIPVTSLARTLVDLADVLDEKRLAAAVHEAEVARRFDLRAVERALERLPGRRGGARLELVLAAYRPEPRFTRSQAERLFLEVCAMHGLPPPLTNHWVAGFEVDAYWPDLRIAVEIDGARAHATARAFQADRQRDRRLAAAGIRVVRVTWRDLQDGARLAAELLAIRAACARAAGSPPAPACA